MFMGEEQHRPLSNVLKYKPPNISNLLEHQNIKCLTKSTSCNWFSSTSSCMRIPQCFHPVTVCSKSLWRCLCATLGTVLCLHPKRQELAEFLQPLAVPHVRFLLKSSLAQRQNSNSRKVAYAIFLLAGKLSMGWIHTDFLKGAPRKMYGFLLSWRDFLSRVFWECKQEVFQWVSNWHVSGITSFTKSKTVSFAQYVP